AIALNAEVLGQSEGHQHAAHRLFIRAKAGHALTVAGGRGNAQPSQSSHWLGGVGGIGDRGMGKRRSRACSTPSCHWREGLGSSIFGLIPVPLIGVPDGAISRAMVTRTVPDLPRGLPMSSGSSAAASLSGY